MKKRQGFTLVELMIAMAIIAILATAGVSAYTGYMKKGRDTARAQIAHKLNSSVMAYAASNGGKPPGDMTAFNNFLRDAGDTFGGGISGSGGTGGGSSTAFIKDPVGGKDVCLDANKEANQPCRFDYTAYNDGTYAISYGVEDKSSMKQNFYKTTKSVLLTEDTANVAKSVNEQSTKPKYGVYVGTAPFIGKPSTTSNLKPEHTYDPGEDDDGVDQTYTPPSGGPIGLTVSYRSVRIDVPVDPPAATTPSTPVTPPAIAAEGPCTPSDQCVSGYECSTISNTCQKACSGTIRAEDDRCWYATNLPEYYQWMRKTPVTQSSWPAAASWTGDSNNSDYGDPCKVVSGNTFHTPTQLEWQNFITKAQAAGVTDLTSSLLHLPKDGYRDVSNGIQYDQGVIGDYWSSTPDGTVASYLYFSSGYAYAGDDDSRANGFSVRCLQD